MNIVLWIVQALLAFGFFASGAMKVFAFDKMAAQSPDLAHLHGLFLFIGLCEIAGAIGLILPGITGYRRNLTGWAAAGLGTIMVLAGAFHLSRGEASHLPPVIVLLLLAAFVVWGRGFGKYQLSPHNSAETNSGTTKAA